MTVVSGRENLDIVLCGDWRRDAKRTKDAVERLPATSRFECCEPLELQTYGVPIDAILSKRLDEETVGRCLAVVGPSAGTVSVKAHYLDDFRRVEVFSSNGSWRQEVRAVSLLYIDAHHDHCALEGFCRTVTGQWERENDLAETTASLAAELISVGSQERVKPNLAAREPVVFLPTASEFVHEVLGHGLGSLAKAHPQQWQVGEELGSSYLSVLDDATLDSGFASRHFDDFGFISRRICLLKRGVVCEGFRFPFGSFARSDHSFPLEPRLSNLRVLPNPQRRSLDDLCSAISKGILVKRLRKAAFFPSSGRFALETAEAQRIRNGEPAEELATMQITGSAREGIERISDLDDQQVASAFICSTRTGPAPTSVVQPSILVDGLFVVPGPSTLKAPAFGLGRGAEVES